MQSKESMCLVLYPQRRHVIRCSSIHTFSLVIKLRKYVLDTYSTYIGGAENILLISHLSLSYNATSGSLFAFVTVASTGKT